MSVNTTVASGLAGQLVAQNESTYGVSPAWASGFDTFEFLNETLKLKKNTVQGQGLHGKVGTLPLYERTARRVITSYGAEGDITMELPSNNLGFWLQHMIGSYGQTLATPTQMGTTGVFKQVHQPGSLFGHSFAVQKGVPSADNGVVEPFTYVGCKVASWTISVDVNAIGQLQLSLNARNELAGAGNGDPLNASVPTLAVPAYPVGMQLFNFREATLYTSGTPTLSTGVVSLTGATAAANVSKASITHAVTFGNPRLFLGSNGYQAEPRETGYRKISGSFDVEWLSDEGSYNAFAEDTTTSLKLTFVGPVIGTSGANTSLLDIIVPNIKLEGDSPNVSGPGVVQTSMPFTGSDDETTTQIQITYQSTDTSL